MPRTVSVSLALDVSRYVTAGRQATKVTRDFRTELSAAASRGDLDAVAGQATAAGLALTGAFAGITLVSARFDKAMSSVSAATLASASDMEKLRQAALDAGADTAFSATEAAEGIEELAKAGINTADILSGGLAGSLDLAAAGQIGVGEAAETAASAMTQFNLKGRDVTHIADLLAAGAGKAQGSVGDMAMALKQGGLVAAQTGLSIEEATGTLAAFASAGLLGSDAGTSFKTMLLRLAAPTGKAAELMNELGISAFDSSGQFVGMAKFAGNLQQALAGMSQQQRQAALSTIFGTDAIRSASIVYQQGQQGIQGWIDATNDQGFAAETAERKLDNLMGDVEALTGSLETLAIQSGSGANEGLRILTQGATALVNQFGELPPVISGTAVVLAGVTGAALLAFAAFIRMRGSAAMALAELRAMGPAGAMAATGMQRAAKGAGIAAGALAALQLASLALEGVLDNDLNPQIDAFVAGLDRWGSQGRLAGEAARILGDDAHHLRSALRTLADDGSLDSINRSGRKFWEGLIPALDGAEQSVGRAENRIEALDTALAQLHSGGDAAAAAEVFNQVKAAAEEQGISVEKLMNLFPEYRAALEVAAAQGGETAAGMDEMGGAASAAAEDVEELKEAFDELFGIQMDLDRAQIAYKEGLVELKEALNKGATSLSANTEAGRTNRTAVLDQVEAIADLRQANIDNGMSIENANGIYDKQLGQLEKTLLKLGFNEGAVRDLIGSYRDIPGRVSTTVSTPGLQSAIARAETMKRRLDAIDRFVKISFKTVGAAPAGSFRVAQRHGGIVAAQHGRLVPAHITDSPTVLYGERATEREAFIPKQGDPRRSKAIIAEAASWYGMAVTAARKGMVQAEDGSWVPLSFYSKPVKEPATSRKRQMVRAEDGSWVPLSFYQKQREQLATAIAPVRAAMLARPQASTPDSHICSPTINVTPTRLDFGPRELEAVMAAQEARLRVGRPR